MDRDHCGPAPPDDAGAKRVSKPETASPSVADRPADERGNAHEDLALLGLARQLVAIAGRLPPAPPRTVGEGEAEPDHQSAGRSPRHQPREG